MQPVSRGLTFWSGDTANLLINLKGKYGADIRPLTLALGEAFILRIFWPGGQIVATTSSARADRLILTQTTQETTLRRQFTIAETARIPASGALWSLARLPVVGERRTYLTGPVTVSADPSAGNGDTGFTVTVNDNDIIVEVTTDDWSSYTDAQIAILAAQLDARLDLDEAKIAELDLLKATRVELAAAEKRANKRAAGYALMLG